MNHRALSVTIAVICLAGVGAVAWWSYQERTSPGPLHPSHAGVKDLKGNRGCDACHGRGEIVAKVSLAEACIACHRAIGDQLRDATGLHGAIDAPRRRACEACHHEHHGDAVALVPEAAFLAAGVDSVESYDHAHVGGLQLEGVHPKLACTQCHPHANDAALEAGQARYLGLTRACTACHDDAHKGELGNDCAKCHGQESPFKESPLFKHPEAFPLAAGHSGLSCGECHTTPKVFTGLKTDCASCHTDTYDATSKPAHAVAGLGTDCASCHTTETWETADFTHAESFPLIGAHTEVACATCHSAGTAQGQVVVFQSDRTCAACHTSLHSPAMVQGVARALRPKADACAACHAPADTRWRDSVARMTPELHARTGFPLTRPHATQTCAQCHAGLGAERAEPASLEVWKSDYPGRAADACEKCHDDPHRGQFAESPLRSACLHCHERTTFFPTTFGAELHAEGAFPLDGSHRAVACALCHKEAGGVRVFSGTPTACAECHKDVHGGKFDRTALPRVVGGKAGCARCHTTSEFEHVTWSAEDHSAWTGEPLTGKHADASCAACHRRGPSKPGVPAPFASAPKACAACHEDVHAGQFRVNGSIDCARCHGSTGAFSMTRFNHQRDSRFTLDADHASLECAACHRPVEVAGKPIVRYKPLGTQCADCHGTQSVRKKPAGGTP